MEQTKFKGTTNICIDCKNALGNCSWSAIDPKTDKVGFKPVPGWTAEKIMLNLGTYGNSHKRRMIDSYHITACPQFVRG